MSHTESKRCRFRFSLKSLLIVLTLFSIVVGVAAWKRAAALRQYEAVEGLRGHGVVVIYAYQYDLSNRDSALPLH